MHKLTFLLALITLSLASHPVFADAIGTTVTGSLYFNGSTTANYFDRSTGGVPPGYGNYAPGPYTINSGIEFGYQDFFNLDTADFTGTTLTVQDVVSFATGAYEMDFTDTYFTGFSPIALDPGFTYTFSGNTLKVFFAENHTPGTYTATFNINGGSNASNENPTAVTPEPSSLILLGTGALSALGAARRKLLSR